MTSPSSKNSFQTLPLEVRCWILLFSPVFIILILPIVIFKDALKECRKGFMEGIASKPGDID
jgi:hypothetical protein